MAGEITIERNKMLSEVYDKLVEHGGFTVVLEPWECDILTRNLPDPKKENTELGD